ncbi:MAG: UvrB/UvrC motif-containing protein [Clostridia bacterium]|nr:UvrB/UvrC motif-containing protein [Clostridia bacterium]
MRCEKCQKNNVSVYYKETVNGKTTAMGLCKECASELMGDDNKSFYSKSYEEFKSLFESLFGLPTPNEKTFVGEPKKCNLCQSSFSDLVSSGKAGCPMCYRVFADELIPTVSKIHGNTTHVGLVPDRYRAGFERKDKIKKLEAELKEAVANEEYEKAASLRDELKTLRDETSENI